MKIGLGLLIKKGRVVIQTEDAALAGGGGGTPACRCVGPISEATETDYTSLAAREASHAEIVAKTRAAGLPPAGIMLSASSPPAGLPHAGTQWRAP
jgi:hypothetical protein